MEGNTAAITITPTEFRNDYLQQSL